MSHQPLFRTFQRVISHNSLHFVVRFCHQLSMSGAFVRQGAVAGRSKRVLARSGVEEKAVHPSSLARRLRRDISSSSGEDPTSKVVSESGD